MDDIVTVQNVIGAILSGIFGLMWWDVRSIRKEFRTLTAETDLKLDSKLSKATHELICKNSGLIVAAMLEQKFKEYHDENKREFKEFRKEVIDTINKHHP